MDYFVHPLGLVESLNIGKDTRIWAFAHILPGAAIGEDCNICDHVFIENDVIVGNRVTIKSGVQLWDGIRIADDVFIGPNVAFTNDPFPRSKQHPEKFATTFVRQGASIGANATILPGLTIGRNAMVGAGSVVTRDVPPNAIVMGNPAQITGYVENSRSSYKSHGQETRIVSGVASPREIAVPRVTIHFMPMIDDLRGSLTFGEYDKHLPFVPQRYFVVYHVPTREVRGEHAHKRLHQLLICLKGTCTIAVDDGSQRDSILLDSPGIGLHIPPLIWSSQYHFSADCMLLVLASDVYSAEDYIRDYDEFLKQVAVS